MRYVCMPEDSALLSLHKSLRRCLDVIDEQQEECRILQGVRDAVSHHVGSVLHVYAVNADEINLETTLERTANSPSLADILEWLKDTEKFFRNQHLERKNLLYMGNDHLQDIRNLYNTWEKLNDLSSIRQNIVQDMLLKVSLFRQASN
ncbi:hypothetical protein GDO81_005951 [Engystomops pustulosus]|uniref:Uncharacterized protein n=1 Tax=Engystomops pustulosus TaxID=76066 RepID=A0AAV7CUF9_ENGPU|nr:hypothetical protein GDO81_005951 [Engystomops pustulosus]